MTYYKNKKGETVTLEIECISKCLSNEHQGVIEYPERKVVFKPTKTVSTVGTEDYNKMIAECKLYIENNYTHIAHR